MRTYLPILISVSFLVPAAVACGGIEPVACAENDGQNGLGCDGLPDDLGRPVTDSDGNWLTVDQNGDGKIEGYAVDTNGDGLADAVTVDIDRDGDVDGIDTNVDGIADRVTGQPSGSGGTTGAGGSPPSAGGQPAASGGSQQGTGGGSTPNLEGSCLTGTAKHSGGGVVSDQYADFDTYRYNCSDTAACPIVRYKFMANGWGPNWQSHTIGYGGTTIDVQSLQGQVGDNYEPAGYPTVFCGLYSQKSSGACGLPKKVSELTEIDTGLTWSGVQNSHNVAYDIWMGNGPTAGDFAGFLMVWYHDPSDQQPAGSVRANNVSVGGELWDVWTGTVGGKPIVNYVHKGDIFSYAFDALEFVNHAKSNYQLPGDTVQSVAVGFEIWKGPTSGLKIEDFCVEVH